MLKQTEDFFVASTNFDSLHVCIHVLDQSVNYELFVRHQAKNPREVLLLAAGAGSIT
jgi:hypothetical protein